MQRSSRRRLRARPLLVAVGTLAVAGCARFEGTLPNPCAAADANCPSNAGGSGGSDDLLDLAVPTSPPDLKPTSD